MGELLQVFKVLRGSWFCLSRAKEQLHLSELKDGQRLGDAETQDPDPRVSHRCHWMIWMILPGTEDIFF